MKGRGKYLKRIAVIIFVIGLIITVYAIGQASSPHPINPILVDLPFDLEQHNPVPMTLHWNQGDKSYYYFSWGLKPTAGYRLEYTGMVKNVIKIRAIAPSSGQMVAQVQTYPKLLLLLPKGEYSYQIKDGLGKEVSSKLQLTAKSLAFQIYLPVNGKLESRRIWRDSEAGLKGNSSAQIAVEALLAQPEMNAYQQKEVRFLALSPKGNQWFVQMNKGYLALKDEERTLLDEAITRTLMGLDAQGMQKVVIATAIAKSSSSK